MIREIRYSKTFFTMQFFPPTLKIIKPKYDFLFVFCFVFFWTKKWTQNSFLLLPLKTISIWARHFFMKKVMFLLHVHVNCFLEYTLKSAFFSFSWTLSLFWPEFAFINIRFLRDFYFWYCNRNFLCIFIKKISSSFVNDFWKTPGQPFTDFLQNLCS